MESEALNFEGHERNCVRSTALLALGIFNLLTSMLPPSAMKAASWITGFQGGCQIGLEQVRSCWSEGGIQAPFAGLVLTGMAVDVSSFLGELDSERDAQLKEARRVLDWAADRYPDSFFYALMEASHRAASRDLPGAVATMQRVHGTVQELPAFVFLVHVRIATFQACSLQWCEAAEAWRAALNVHQSVRRRAFCPTLAMNAYLCHMAAGERERAVDALGIARSYQAEEKKWSRLDAISLEQAEKAHRVAAAAEGGDEQAEQRAMAAESWRPLLVLCLKVCVIYRGVHFMSKEQEVQFLDLLQAATKACSKNDADGRALGTMVWAEAMRQSERWDEALCSVAEADLLMPKLSQEGEKGGIPQFVALVRAYALYAKGDMSGAKEALVRLDSLRNDHFFKRAVEFKATHLQRLVGMAFQDWYLEVDVAARSKTCLVADIPDGIDHIEWDLVLAEYSVIVTVRFRANGAGRVVQRLVKHQADDGPMIGGLDISSPGRLEVVIDNTFSVLRSKTLHCRLQPDGLRLRQDGAD